MSIENNIDFDHPYSLHKVCGLNENVSIAFIGKLNKDELSFLKSLDFDFGEIGWPSTLDEKDLLLNEKFPINLEEAVKEDGFVLFGALNKYGSDKTEKSKIEAFYNIAHSRFELMSGRISDNGAFCSYFAHLHNDTSVSEVRGQINFIIDNPLGHALISKSVDGVYHKIIPQKGDIIFLDIHCEHAILPNESAGFKKMRKNPMIAAYIS